LQERKTLSAADEMYYFNFVIGAKSFSSPLRSPDHRLVYLDRDTLFGQRKMVQQGIEVYLIWHLALVTVEKYVDAGHDKYFPNACVTNQMRRPCLA
jgi:hypothetical protein